MNIKILLFLYLFSFVFVLEAQWSANPDSNLQIGYGMDPQIVSDEKGGAFVVWDAGGGYLRLQKVDKYGYKQWTATSSSGGVSVNGNFAGNCNCSLSEFNSIVYDGIGGVYIIFSCDSTTNPWDPQPAKSYIQHIDSLGNRLWGDGIRPFIRNNYQDFAGTIVEDDAEGAILSIYNEDTQYGGTSRYLQRIDNGGNYVWGDSAIQVGSGYEHYMIKDGSGGLIINWGGGHSQRLDNSGNKLWGLNGILVPFGAANTVINSVENTFYTIGSEWLGYHINEYIKRFVLQKLSLTDGSLLWDSTGVTIDTVNVSSGIYDMNIDLDKNIWIAWNRFQVDAFIQKFTTDGNPQFSLPGIPGSQYPSSKGGYKFQPSSDSSMIIMWGDDRNGISSSKYAQKFKEENQYHWSEDVLISNIPGGPDNTTDNRGGVIISWDDIMGGFKIYIQQVSKNGNLGEIISTIKIKDEINLPNDYFLFQNYPNPFNSFTAICYSIPFTDFVQLKLFNILGQEVKTLVNEKQNGGKYSINLNMSEMPSGVYYYQIKTQSYSNSRKLLYLK